MEQLRVRDQQKRMNTSDLVRCFYEEIWNCGNKPRSLNSYTKVLPFEVR